MDLVRSLEEAAQLHADALEGIHRGAGDRALTASEQRKFDAHVRSRDDLERAAVRIEQEFAAARNARVAERRARFGIGLSASHSSSPWEIDHRAESPSGWISRGHAVLEQRDSGISDRAAEALATAMTDSGGDLAARFIVARSNPDYLAAFAKFLTNPERGMLTLTSQEAAAFALVESTRAVMSTSAGTAGAIIPLSLDPNLAAIVNNGVASPWRALSNLKVTASSPYRAVTSAGITASWTAEGSAWGDASPALGAVDIPLAKLSAFVSATFEIFADAGDQLVTLVPTLLADARDVAEANGFSLGSGSDAPKGIIPALVATTGSIITATTRGTFTSASTADIFALLNAIPARARQSGRVAAFANIATINTIRQMTVGTAGATLTDLTAAVPTPLGVPLYESSNMTAATTSGSYLVCAMDMSKYCIVDSVAGPTLEFVPVLFDQATGRPNGTRGWVYHHRTGADVLDGTQGRVLMT